MMEKMMWWTSRQLLTKRAHRHMIRTLTRSNSANRGIERSFIGVQGLSTMIPKTADFDLIDNDAFGVITTKKSNTLDSQPGIHPEVVKNLARAGLNSLFTVQQETLEKSLSGKDLIVRSRTGTGKTLAFGIPLVTRIMQSLDSGATVERGRPLGLVLAPTRELARQVTDELQKAAGNAFKCLAVYGGDNKFQQIKQLLDPNFPTGILVATMGRLCDIAESGNKLDLSGIETVVLDEADEMLRMDHKDALDEVFSHLPPKEQRQTLLFSATFDNTLKRIVQTYMNDYELINLVDEDESKLPAKIEVQNVIANNHNDEISVLASLLRSYSSKKARILVFSRTKIRCDEISSSIELFEAGVTASSLNGDMDQQARNLAMDRFKDGRLQCLVATDVAARGLDIDGVDLVVHVGLPESEESFVHRSGRTGRAGREGRVVVISSFQAIPHVKKMGEAVGKEIVQIKASTSNVRADQLKSMTARLLNSKLEINPIGFDEWSADAEDELSEFLDTTTFANESNEVRDKAEELIFKVLSSTMPDADSESVEISALGGLPKHKTVYLRETENGSQLLSDIHPAGVFKKLSQTLSDLGFMKENGPQVVKQVHVTKDENGAIFDVPLWLADKLLEDSEALEQRLGVEMTFPEVLPPYTLPPRRNQRDNQNSNKRGGYRGGKYTNSRGGNYSNRGNGNNYNRRDRDGYSGRDRGNSRDRNFRDRGDDWHQNQRNNRNRR